ncbi:MAG: SDR family NAD(P)-dependent oxidoreductase, partial [Oscillospiraceae bacterium]|nr:SDR family NAD(P)-dependent oxidoreductase [Oscillospiraceae bacterium]
MSILVSGGAGYIGSHTCVELLNAGYDIVVVDNLSNSSEESLRRVEKITGKSVPFIKVDLCDEAATEEVFNKFPEIDSVIHFAGLKAVGESVAMPLAYYRNNLLSTMTLCKVLGDRGVKKIVFS